ncbi:acyl-coenzyme A diphosphatase FITM2 [Bombina bombina]|uniref:acyl-coenzyme A diphosphatase FITM2 n=1 Tax=Bombina bombina TaxID=8345 RepID=UPI00235AECD3|nr:acyl-coenzyme A diphosphatase FITM2 [Bombina bombina]
MERLDRLSSLIQRKFLNETFRRHFCVVLACIVVGGSIVKEFSPLPDTYLSNKRNFLNVYFVKFSWAWTFFLLLPFITLTNYILTQSSTEVLRRLMSLFVGTVIWFICTKFFMFIENVTGSCYTSQLISDIKQPADKRECMLKGGTWHGFDISGHSFLLPYCVLIILEETVVIHNLRLDGHWKKTIINALFVALGLLSLIWVWMLFCTAIYFHDFWQKIIGAGFGILGWFVTYKYWYVRTFSPGLPPASANRRLKQKNYSN